MKYIFILTLVVVFFSNTVLSCDKIIKSKDVYELKVENTHRRSMSVHAHINNNYDKDINVLVKAKFYLGDKVTYESFVSNKNFKANTKWNFYIYSLQDFDSVEWNVIVK